MFTTDHICNRPSSLQTTFITEQVHNGVHNRARSEHKIVFDWRESNCAVLKAVLIKP